MTEYGLIGFPLTHSFSKKYFTEKFKKESIHNAGYSLFEIPQITALPALLENNKNLYGLSVTIPYKETVIPFLDSISPEAAQIGAVNCIKIQRELDRIKTTGYNTDIYGFTKSLTQTGQKFQKALILGTGGAAKAVAYSLQQEEISWQFVSRNPEHHENTIGYSDINKAVLNECDLIVNATPLGTYPNIEGCPDLPFQHIDTRHFVFDLVYNPAQTKLMRICAQKGAKVLNGMDMLCLQADKAFDIFKA